MNESFSSSSPGREKQKKAWASKGCLPQQATIRANSIISTFESVQFKIAIILRRKCRKSSHCFWAFVRSILEGNDSSAI